MEKYTREKIPSGRTTTGNSFGKLYEETLINIKKVAAKNYIWFSVDETTNQNSKF